VRRAPSDPRNRPLTSFLLTASEASAAVEGSRRGSQSTNWIQLPRGRHVVLSACRDNEEAREVAIGDAVRGVFSYFLVETLRTAHATLTYRDLFKRTSALVRSRVFGQSPVIEATALEDLDRPFLGSTTGSHTPYYTVSLTTRDGWVMDAGAMHGIPKTTTDGTTQLALFDFGATEFDDMAAAVGEAEVSEVLPTRTKLRIALRSGGEPDPCLTFKAIVTSLPLRALCVQFAGCPAGLQLLRDALSKAGPTGGSSLLVREAAMDAEIRVVAGNSSYRMMKAKALQDRSFADVSGTSADAASEVIRRLEHIARWTTIAELSNPTSRLAPHDVRIDIYRCDPRNTDVLKAIDEAGRSGSLQLDYELHEGEWRAAEFKLKLTNTSQKRLFCMLFDLTDTYMVSPELLPGGGIWLGPGEEAWAHEGRSLSASIPDELWQQDWIELKDLLKLIVTTEESDATLLAQGDLGAKLDHGNRAITVRPLAGAVDHLMTRVHSRHVSTKPPFQGSIPDWTTSELTITIVRPPQHVAIPTRDAYAALSSSVRVMRHPSLIGNARLTSVALASRDGAMPTIPPLLRDDPVSVQLHDLGASRGGPSELNALELFDVADHTVVTREQPLVIHVDAELGAGEHVLPIAYDGEFFLPVGRSKRTDASFDLIIDWLPSPVTTRSLTSAVRILLHKIAAERFGLEFLYPLISIVGYDGARISDPATIRQRVASAERLLLYVHGIIGDTRDMAASAFVDPGEISRKLSAPAHGYDLVLAFDYEKLRTPIEQTARELKSRLEEIGLRAGHGKTLHIVAHSMGGLIARWFLERESGNAIAQHLVMLGTPNEGSPWSAIQDWASIALTLALNGLTTAAWSAKVLSSLVVAIEAIDATLDQMAPDSKLLKVLAESSDPGIAYTIIAGNTSIISMAMSEQRESLLNRLLSRLSPRHILHRSSALAFFGRANDIAVSVTSICAVPPSRRSQVRIREVACDHLSYFTSELGVRALGETLSAIEG
jgi:pimeloyl-ACP methyl ester carboxylesterase